MKRPGFIFCMTALLLLLVAPAHAQTFLSAPSLEQALAGFGGAVAASDDAVFVGEPQMSTKPGVVYVFEQDSYGTWTETAQLMASDGETDDRFGSAVAVDGNTLLVGATRPDSSRGAVYVFEKNNGAWTQTARFTADDLAAGDNFGAVLALSGNHALVTAPSQNDRAGAVYAFMKHNGMWMQHAKLGTDIETNDRFGTAIALDGNMALIGAPRQDNNKGNVYTYWYDEAAGAWMEKGLLESENLSVGSRFGSALTINDGWALVGAPMAGGFTGAAFAFQYDEAAGTWMEKGMIEPETEERQLRFGSTVDFGDGKAWVGAPGANGFTGMIYLYEAGGDWAAAGTIAQENGASRGFFGGTMDVHDDLAVVGIPGSDYGAGTAAIFGTNASGEWEEQSTIAGPVEGFDAVTGGQVDCTDGEASGFDCSDVDLVSFLPVKDIGGGRGVRTNDVWGWTDPDTGKEWAIVGRVDGTAFVDISDPANPVYVGNLEKTEGAPGSVWRDMKVYKNHVFIVADGAGEHGMQVFDLTQLRDVDNPPVEFEETAHYSNIHSAHNIVINEDTGYAYAVGASSGGETCGGGLHMINIQDPTNPEFVGCFADPATGRASTGYSHDAQCVTYSGPDVEHQGKEICLGANETALSIADVTDKENPIALSNASYPNVGYAHQGWLTEDQRYFFLDDELDELSGTLEGTRTLIWDVSDLDDPQLVREYISEDKSSDHNLYIKGNLMYQSNYQSGLRILDISDPANPHTVGYFDTVPYGENKPSMGGSWSNYPFFKSGVIVVTSGHEGVFILKKKEVDI